METKLVKLSLVIVARKQLGLLHVGITCRDQNSANIRTFIMLQTYACGFLGQQPNISTSFRVLSDNEAQASLVPGGWGCVGLVCQGVLRLHAGQEWVSQQQDAP